MSACVLQDHLGERSCQILFRCYPSTHSKDKMDSASDRFYNFCTFNLRSGEYTLLQKYPISVSG